MNRNTAILLIVVSILGVGVVTLCGFGVVLLPALFPSANEWAVYEDVTLKFRGEHVSAFSWTKRNSGMQVFIRHQNEPPISVEQVDEKMLLSWGFDGGSELSALSGLPSQNMYRGFSSATLVQGKVDYLHFDITDDLSVSRNEDGPFILFKKLNRIELIEAFGEPKRWDASNVRRP